MNEPAIVANAPAAITESKSPPGNSGATAKRGWRPWACKLLLAVFMLSAGLTVPAVWARNQVLDTDRFVQTVSPLAAHEDIQQAVAARVTSYITSAVASSQVVTEGGALASLIPMATTAAVDSVTQDFVASPQFEVLWEEVARAAHTGFQALLSGGESEFFSSDNGQVVLDLSPIVAAVNDEMAARGISITLPGDRVTFVLFESEALANAQDVAQFLDQLAIILPIIALVALAGYLLLSPNKWGALVVASLGLAIMMTVTLIFLAVSRWLYLRELGESVDKDAATAMFDILTHYLRVGLRIIGLAALLLSIAVYFTLRDRFAVKHEREGAGRSLYERWPMLGRLENAVATNRVASLVAWTVIVIAIVLLWDWQDIGWAIVLLVIGLAGAFTIFRFKPVPPELLAPLPHVEPSTVASAGEAMTSSLERLGELKSKGLLSEAEFAQAKAVVLGAA